MQVHVSIVVKSVCLEYLAIVSKVPDFFANVNIDEFSKHMIKRAFFTSASAVSEGEINCQAYSI